MALKTFKPRSEGMRFRVASTFEEITEKRPVKSLTRPKRKTAGRNNQGRITTRHHGGGAKQRYRIVDFRRAKDGVEAEVKAIAYDPNRSANLALLEYADGVKTYILARSARSRSACSCTPLSSWPDRARSSRARRAPRRRSWRATRTP